MRSVEVGSLTLRTLPAPEETRPSQIFSVIVALATGLLFGLATVYRTIYTIAGGYITARLAPDRPMRHAMVLGAIGMAAATAGTVATWGLGPEFGPKWYPISLVVLALPSIWAGARLRMRNVRS